MVPQSLTNPQHPNVPLNVSHPGLPEVKTEVKEETKGSFPVGGLLDGREEKVKQNFFIDCYAD